MSRVASQPIKVREFWLKPGHLKIIFENVQSQYNFIAVKETSLINFTKFLKDDTLKFDFSKQIKLIFVNDFISFLC